MDLGIYLSSNVTLYCVKFNNLKTEFKKIHMRLFFISYVPLYSVSIDI